MSILVVDDSRLQRASLAMMLGAAGYTDVLLAASGEEAIQVLSDPKHSVELLLTDLNMPGLSGIGVCQRVKAMPELTDLPIIVITSSDEVQDLHEAFLAGAVDYITKPAKELELLARVRSALKLRHEMAARKARELDLSRLNQRLEHLYAELADKHRDLQAEKEKSERLLLNVLPAPIAHRLRSQTELHMIADHFTEVTVLFADIVGFTALSRHMEVGELVALLNAFFSLCDRLAEKHGLEKIKTIGDAYMAVAGLPEPRADHVEAAANMALELREEIGQLADGKINLRMGLHSGPVVAGVIGVRKFAYDLWGATVNVASRMESHSIQGGIQTTVAVFERLKQDYLFSDPSEVSIKGMGNMKTYLLAKRGTSRVVG
jgi:class 3 adenylate cyclase/CheY-like chemotaxis protein